MPDTRAELETETKLDGTKVEGKVAKKAEEANAHEKVLFFFRALARS